MCKIQSNVSFIFLNSLRVLKPSALVLFFVMVLSVVVTASETSELNLPASAAMNPTESQNSVISVYSNEYSALSNTNYLANWSTGSLTEIVISENDVLSYTGMGYVGIEMPVISATSYKSFHADIWSPVDVFVKVKIVNKPGPSSTEGVWIDSVSAGQWKEFLVNDISSSDIASIDEIGQIVFDVVDSDGSTISDASIVVDNVYFFEKSYKAPDPVSLTVYNPDAQSIQLTGPLWNWSLVDGPLATPNDDGTWTVELNPGPAVDQQYLWVADGVQEILFDNHELGECVDNGLNVGVTNALSEGDEYANRVLVVGQGDVTGDHFGACQSDVTFTVTADNASSVLFYSDNNGWDLETSPAASKADDGTWSVTLSPAPTSDINYLWVVDDQPENLVSQVVAGACENDGLNTESPDSAKRVWVAGSGNVSGEIYNKCTTPVYNFSATFSEDGRLYSWRDIGPDVEPSVNTLLIDDPDQAGNSVAYSMRNANGVHPSGDGKTTKPWNGTLFVVTEDNEEVGFNFADGDRVASMRVRSSTIGKPVSLKFESIDGEGGVLAKSFTSVTDQWETLYFDFSTPAEGHVFSDIEYSRAIIIYDQNSDSTDDQFFYFDDITYGDVQPPVDTGPLIELPVDFELNANEYPVGSDGNSVIEITAGPDGGSSLKYVKHGEEWGGAIINLDTPVDFKDGYIFSARVYSSAERTLTMKFNDASTDEYPVQVTVPMAGTGWQTLTFDFSGVPLMPQTKFSFIQDIENIGGGNEEWTIYIDDITQLASDYYIPDDTQTFSLVVNNATSVRMIADWNWDMNSSESPIALYSGNNTWTVVMDTPQAEAFEYLWVVDGSVENLLDNVVADECEAKLDAGTLVTDEIKAVYANRKWLTVNNSIRDSYDNCIPSVILTVKIEGVANDVRMVGPWWDADNPVNKADVAVAGNPWDVNLSGYVDVTAGADYTLSFDVTGADRTIVAGIGQSAAPYLGHTETVTLSATTQTIVQHLTAKADGAGEDFGGATTRVIFDMGADAGAVSIDNVSLVAGHNGTVNLGVAGNTGGDTGGDTGGVVAGNLVTDGTFDEATSTTWYGNAYNPVEGWDIDLGPIATKNEDDSWFVALNPEEDLEYLWVVDGVQESLVENAQDGECASDENAGILITNHSTYANRILKFDTGDVTNIYGACSDTVTGFDDTDEDGTVNAIDSDDDNDDVNDELDSLPYDPNFSAMNEAAFILEFDGATREADTHVFTFPASAKSWAGFANGNEALYPITLPVDHLVVFTASVPEGGNADVRFMLQNAPYPNNDVEAASSVVKVIGDTEATYTATFDSQGAQQFLNLLMYLDTKDTGVMIKHVSIVEASAFDSDGDGVVNSVDAFPNDPNESVDTDNDGIGNNADTDDDGDSVPDAEDSAPLNPTIGSNSSLPKQQVYVSGSPSMRLGESVAVTVEYNVSNGEENLTGLGLRVHFDSDVLTFVSGSDVFAKDNTSSPALINDSDDYDGDPATDSFVLLSWDSTPDQWPGALPQELATLNYNVADQFSGIATPIRFSSTSNSSGYNFSGTDYEMPISSGGWDFDENGQVDALTDGLMLLRYTFGLRGDALIVGAIAENSDLSGADVEANIVESTEDFADIDGNGAVDALTDGLMLLRYLFGLRGDALIAEAVALDSSRTSAAQIEEYIVSLMPQ